MQLVNYIRILDLNMNLILEYWFKPNSWYFNHANFQKVSSILSKSEINPYMEE